LTALSPNILRISISPANDTPQMSEFGVVKDSGSVLAGPGDVQRATISWGKYSVTVADGPLHVGVYESGNLRQEVRFDLDSTAVRFNLDGPVFGLGEGVHPYDRRGTRDPLSATLPALALH